MGKMEENKKSRRDQKTYNDKVLAAVGGYFRAKKRKGRR